MRISHNDGNGSIYSPWSDQGVETHLVMVLDDEVVAKAMLRTAKVTILKVGEEEQSSNQPIQKKPICRPIGGTAMGPQ